MKKADKCQMRKIYANQGFTLMEMIVVIVILGILMAILVPGIIRYISKAKETACQVNKRELLHELYYEVGVDSKMLTQDDLQNYVTNSEIKCSEGGAYKVKLTMNDKNVPEIELICNIHDTAVSSNWQSQELYDNFLNVWRTMSEDEKVRYGNDYVRKLYYEKYGALPTIKIEGNTLYIQPYFAKTSKTAWLYTTKNSDVTSGNKWETSYIYNPAVGKWYKPLKGDGNKAKYSMAKFGTMTEEEIQQVLNGDDPKWVEVTDYEEFAPAK